MGVGSGAGGGGCGVGLGGGAGLGGDVRLGGWGDICPCWASATRLVALSAAGSGVLGLLLGVGIYAGFMLHVIRE